MATNEDNISAVGLMIETDKRVTYQQTCTNLETRKAGLAGPETAATIQLKRDPRTNSDALCKEDRDIRVTSGSRRVHRIRAARGRITRTNFASPGRPPPAPTRPVQR
ncbi:hypothetical protein EVAR_27867_1 [Eumeta japonica]|uniref:Uncharacterized protein n=1 Tax=Eumeta variegata TaxID=151549 RepID=A0A4C1VJB5_EUMVA|nr:hypothetical protein EVAR_27867_1 [Eumeta japonica]